MYGFSPPSVESTLVSYCIYYSFPIQFLFDPKSDGRLERCEGRREIAGKACALLRSYALVTVMISLLEPRSYELFGSAGGRVPVGTDLGLGTHRNGPLDFLRARHVMNNFAVAGERKLTSSRSQQQGGRKVPNVK